MLRKMQDFLFILESVDSVAQIGMDPLRDSKVLISPHEKTAPPTYRTTNWRAYNATLKQRRSLEIWFDP